VRADTSQTRLNRRPKLPGCRTQTLPESLQTSIAAARSTTSSCSASGISTGTDPSARCRPALFLLTHFAFPPIEFSYSMGVGRPGTSVKGTEILTGVLEATVRDPCRSGPGAKLTCGLSHPRSIGVGGHGWLVERTAGVGAHTVLCGVEW
jgi:hypothetical protein